MRTITGKVLAQLADYSYLTPEDFKDGDAAKVINGLVYYSRQLGGKYAVVGEATITIELIDTDAIVAHKVEGLRELLQKTQADAEVECNRIREQINSLLAIEYKPEVEA